MADESLEIKVARIDENVKTLLALGVIVAKLERDMLIAKVSLVIVFILAASKFPSLERALAAILG